MKSLSAAKARLLQLVACRVVPEVQELEPDRLVQFFAIIDRALQDRPEGVRRQFSVFLGVIRWAPLLRFGAPFDRLAPHQQDAWLTFLQSCPLSLLRKGFWGLKAIVFMGYYGQPEVWTEVGYAPQLRRKEALDA